MACLFLFLCVVVCASGSYRLQVRKSDRVANQRRLTFDDAMG